MKTNECYRKITGERSCEVWHSIQVQIMLYLPTMFQHFDTYPRDPVLIPPTIFHALALIKSLYCPQHIIFVDFCYLKYFDYNQHTNKTLLYFSAGVFTSCLSESISLLLLFQCYCTLELNMLAQWGTQQPCDLPSCVFAFGAGLEGNF